MGEGRAEDERATATVTVVGSMSYGPETPSNRYWGSSPITTYELYRYRRMRLVIRGPGGRSQGRGNGRRSRPRHVASPRVPLTFMLRAFRCASCLDATVAGERPLAALMDPVAVFALPRISIRGKLAWRNGALTAFFLAWVPRDFPDSERYVAEVCCLMLADVELNPTMAEDSAIERVDVVRSGAIFRHSPR